MKKLLIIPLLFIFLVCFLGIGCDDEINNSNNDVNNSESLQYILDSSGQGYIVTGRGLVSENEIIIPETYKDKPVTAIAKEAFLEEYNIYSIRIPNTVTRIGERAFASCESLSSLEIGSGVITIGNGAFSSCASLISVVIPRSIESIGEFTFSSCDSLTSVLIPDSVKKIGNYAFFDCDSLTVYAQAKIRPNEWDIDWNGGSAVVWGHKIEE